MVDVLSWQDAFVATTLMVGGSVDEARACLLEADAGAARPLVTRLASSDRGVRAKALALPLAQLAAELDAAGVA
jgi:hypothetical protein